MANHQRRPELKIRDIGGMFQQASISFRASVTLFLTLALLSSIHETAVERSAFLSGFTLSAQNATLSLHFSLDQKHQDASAPYEERNASITSKYFDAVDAFVSRLLTAFLPPEGITSQESSKGSATEARNSDSEDATQSVDKLQADSQGHFQNDEMSSTNPTPDGKGKAFPSVGASDDESLLDDLKEENEDPYSDIGFTKLKIETVSNYTKEPTQETILDASELSLFTGKLLGGRGLDQGAYPHGGMALLLVLLLLATAVAVLLAIVGFQHVIVLGSVVHSVVSTHMGKRLSLVRVIRSSLKSNVTRLIWLTFLYASLRGFGSIILLKALFGGMMEMEQIEELVFTLSSMAYPFFAPFMDASATSFGMTVRIGIYVGFDFVLEGMLYCIYIIACWDSIMERNNWFIGAISKSYNLIKTLQAQALVIRIVETMVCGQTFKWILQRVIGQFGAAFIISTVQVYFLVLWLIFYMSARSVHDQNSNFSYSTLEDFLDRFK